MRSERDNQWLKDIRDNIAYAREFVVWDTVTKSLAALENVVLEELARS
jgi:hypothetical protein